MFFVSESSRARLARGLPVLVGVLTFAFVWVGRAPPGPWGLDFDYLWTAGRAVWHGGDPYVSINNAIHQGTLRWPFYYPGTAAVLMTAGDPVTLGEGTHLSLTIGQPVDVRVKLQK